MSVGGRIIEIKDERLEDGRIVKRLWVVDTHYPTTETCVLAEPQDDMPAIGEEIWWQSGKIYFARDRKHLKKVGFSYSAPGTRG